MYLLLYRLGVFFDIVQQFKISLKEINSKIKY